MVSSVVSVLHRVIATHPADWRGVTGLLFDVRAVEAHHLSSWGSSPATPEVSV